MKESREGPLGGLLKDMMSGLGKKGLITEEKMAGVWGSAVGKRASRHTKPTSLKKARLVVNVDGSSWLYELTLKKKEILKKLEGKLKGRPIKDIRFRIGEVRDEEKDKLERGKREAG